LLVTPLLLMGAIFLGESRLLNASSVDSRLLLWQASLALWLDHFWEGVGPYGFFWNYPAFLPLGATLEADLLHPHNIWLEVATGWGIPGLGWIIVLLALWLFHAATLIDQFTPRLRWYATGISAALVAAVAHAQVDAFLALADLAAWLFAAMGIWVALVARTQPMRDDSQTLKIAD
jgi:O-antigen ligase